jgi:hypothetical protein
METSITEGTDVYGSDGEKVGSIVAVPAELLWSSRSGFFFPTDYYIPVPRRLGRGGRSTWR